MPFMHPAKATKQACSCHQARVKERVAVQFSHEWREM